MMPTTAKTGEDISENLTFTYRYGGPLEISFELNRDTLGIAGPTGSGKTTLKQY